MGDMRASGYALWPWPTMLDKGERVKVKIPTLEGELVAFGELEEAPHYVDNGGYRFKINTLEPHHVEYHPIGGPIMVLSTYQFGSKRPPVLAGISYSGWFVASTDARFGLHHDDLQVNRDKSAALSAADDPDGTLAIEEPGT